MSKAANGVLTPRGWVRVRLEEVVISRSERVEPRDMANANYVGLEHVEPNTGRLTGIGSARDVRSTANAYYKGDVLYGRLRPYLNKVLHADDSGLCSAEFAVLMPVEISPRFLAWRLRCDDVVRYAMSFNVGVHRPRVRWSQLREFEFLLPPREEQDRIVEAIEEISALVDDADAALGATLRLIEAYVGRGLRDLFWAQDGRPRWETRPLGEICGTSSGGTPSRKERSHFGGDIPWIKIGDLNDGVVTKTEESLTAEGLESSSASLLPAGTLLIAMYGSIGRLGISGMEAATNQAICAFKPNSDVVLRDYLYWFLRASRRDLVRAGYGGAQPNLSQKYIRSIQVPLPSISEQANVVARARQTAEAATQTREAVKRVQEQATTLRRSLLHRAMTGQLVPQYSSDEPASELLSRIQAEKAELKQRIGTARKATSGHQQAA